MKTKARDAYGKLADVDPQDLEAVASAIEGIFVEYPILSNKKRYPYVAAPDYAKLVDVLCKGLLDEPCHPGSELAMTMAVIGNAIAHAAVSRLTSHFGWTEAQEDEACALLTVRRRAGVCFHCRAQTRTPREWFCDDCEEKIHEDAPVDTLSV